MAEGVGVLRYAQDDNIEGKDKEAVSVPAVST